MALSSLCGPDDIITPISQIDELERLSLGYRPAQNYSSDRDAEIRYIEQLRSLGRGGVQEISQPAAEFFNHMGLKDVIRLLGEPPPDYRLLCVERSPYHKVISWAYWVGGYEDYAKTGVTGCYPEKFMSFLGQVINDGTMGSVRNIDLYRGSDGLVKPLVLNFETLSQDFAALMTDLGVVNPPTLPHAKKGLNTNYWSLQDIANLLKPEQVAKINDLFWDEFEFFGFPRIG